MSGKEEKYEKLNELAVKYRCCAQEVVEVLETLTHEIEVVGNFDASEEMHNVAMLTVETLRNLQEIADNLTEAACRIKEHSYYYEPLIPPHLRPRIDS